MPGRATQAYLGWARRSGAWIALIATLSTVPAASAAQIRMSMGAGVALTLPGGRVAILAPDSAGVAVRSVVGAEGPGEPLLREGDRILSLQGTPIASLDAFTAVWGAIPDGAEVVLGVGREAADATVRFARPPRQAEARTLVVQGSAEGAGAWTTAGPPGGGPTEMVIAGARIRNNDEGMPEVVVRGSDPAAAHVPLRVGDVIVAVNGRAIAALAGLELFYTPLSAGAEVALEVDRNGARHTLRFNKPAAR